MKKSIILITVALLTLSGCKQEITSTLYIADLIEVADDVSSEKALTTNAAVKFEMGSAKSCLEKKDKLTSVISPFFTGLNKVQCIKEGSTQFYYGVFDLPLVKVQKNNDLNQKHKGGVSVQLGSNEVNKNIDIFVSIKLDLLSSLDKALRKKFMGSGGVNPEDLKIQITVNNDNREAYGLSVHGVFLDSQAIASGYFKEVKLKKRSESVVRLSDVSIYTLTGQGQQSFVYIGTVFPIKNQK